MQYHAVSIGEAVPRGNFDLKIQSVFDSAVNLRLTDEDRLLTLLVSDHYELPQGIRLLNRNIPFRSLRVGLGAAVRGGILRFDSSSLTIDIRDANVWKCRVPEINLDTGDPATWEAWSIIWDLLNKEQRFRKIEIIADELFRPAPGTALGRRINSNVRQLATSTMQFDLDNAMRGVEGMIGLGPGVTPSGDDILIGYLAGLWSQAGQNQSQIHFILSFGESLMSIAGLTNEISRTYLYHATQGQFSSSLTRLAEKIKLGNGMENAFRHAAFVGHSSGMDSVTGLLIGLCVWNKESPLRQGNEVKEVTWQLHND